MKNEKENLINTTTHNTYFKGGVLLAMITNFALPCLSAFKVCLFPKTYFPDFITRASLELMLSMAFFY